ncbi:MAG: hypothetical protein WDM89_04685 [Rhizomicrobium sp.]
MPRWRGATLGIALRPQGGLIQHEAALALAVLFGTIAYGIVVFLFRKRLPLGRLAGA